MRVEDENELPAERGPREKITGLLTVGGFRTLNRPTDPWGERFISDSTCKYYGVSVDEEAPLYKSEEKMAVMRQQGHKTTGAGIIFPFYNEANELVCQKLRNETNPKGIWYKRDDDAHKEIGFFGQNIFNGEGARSEIAITFGELDAMATFEMLGVPTVSIANGDQSARKEFQKHYGWLNKFSKIILVPDNDQSCRNIIPLLGSIFPRKTYVVELTQFKDPCDYLINRQQAVFRRSFYAAKPYSPEKISPLSKLKNLLFEEPPEAIAQYPWEGLNEKTGGVWEGELVTIKAPPKAGKTSVFSEIAYHLNKTTPYPIGLIYLEETDRDLIYRFASLELSKNLQRSEIRKDVSKEEIGRAIDTVLKDDKIFMLEHFGSCASDFLEEKIKELVLAKGCQFIFFDHISMAITDESNDNERIAIDRLVAAIKTLTVGIPDVEPYLDDKGNTKFDAEGNIELRHFNRKPTVFMIVHVNDNGQTRGSRAPVQMSNTLLSLHRNKLAEDPIQRNTLSIVVEENRRLGETGPACMLQYSPQSGRLSEVPTVMEGVDDTVPVIERGTNGYVYKG